MNMKQFKRKLHKLLPNHCVYDTRMNIYIMNNQLTRYLRNNIRLFETNVTTSIREHSDSTHSAELKFHTRRQAIEYIEENLENFLFELL